MAFRNYMHIASAIISASYELIVSRYTLGRERPRIARMMTCSVAMPWVVGRTIFESEDTIAKGTLSAEKIAIIKSTAPALQKRGEEIMTRMYERLFADPNIKALFDTSAQKSGDQPKRLAGAILAFAQNPDKLEVLASAI